MKPIPLLPTTTVGSHAKPGWWHTCKDLAEKNSWGQTDLIELLNDAVDIAILDQERTGLDIITDGESRRLDGYVDGYYSIIDGIEPVEPKQFDQGRVLKMPLLTPWRFKIDPKSTGEKQHM